MRVKWANVIVLFLIVFAVAIVATVPREIAGFLATMDNIGPGHSTEEKIRGLIALGLVAVTLVAVTKIVCSSNNSDR